MHSREFSERLNHELDNIGLPLPSQERKDAFVKLIKIRPYQAEQILKGHINPQDPVLEKIANELEISVNWLLFGKKH
jgi:transcriptional regulator with XRE-family HTH domain